jgi:hypothetical protein
MGDVFARTVLGLTAPSIGLLNVGSEELKGDDTLRQAAEILRQSAHRRSFHGFVEGHDIAAGTTDVVVTDGFTGNVALKTGEGALKLIGDLLRQVFQQFIDRPRTRLPAGAPSGLDRLREWLDPRRYNGAVMLGLNGVVVKSHGGTDAEGLRACGGRGGRHGGAPVQRPHPPRGWRGSYWTPRMGRTRPREIRRDWGTGGNPNPGNSNPGNSDAGNSDPRLGNSTVGSPTARAHRHLSASPRHWPVRNRRTKGAA